ncbi:MAG: N-acetylmuramoyl-L-alanine amidase [Bacteroidales bacterium]|jgi:N-acetylmuramoyl-L-alanine amidase
MRTITLIILHCSGTPEGKSLSFEACKRDHIKNRGFKDIGYHYYVERDGTLHEGRPLEEVGAHCRLHNTHSIGICYEGGLDEDGQPADTRTEAQRDTLFDLLIRLRQQFPRTLIMGHNDFDKSKPCPCFDVDEYRAVFS